jgi:hypothetical protein
LLAIIDGVSVSCNSSAVNTGAATSSNTHLHSVARFLASYSAWDIQLQH